MKKIPVKLRAVSKSKKSPVSIVSKKVAPKKTVSKKVISLHAADILKKLTSGAEYTEGLLDEAATAVRELRRAACL